MIGLNGGLIGARRSPTAGAAVGLWTPNEQVINRRLKQWPFAEDPDFDKVSLLLPMDGSNGSTTFTDVSSNAVTMTAFGNVQISTTESKWGGASAYFDGSGDYIRATNTNSAFTFLAGEFTYELWFKSADTKPYSALLTRPYSGPGGLLISLNGASADGAPEVYWREWANSLFFKSSIAGLNDGAWHYLAFLRIGTTCYLRVDDQQAAIKTGVTTSVGNSVINIGSDIEFAGRDFIGYIDDLRISSTGRNITAAPTAAFPYP